MTSAQGTAIMNEQDTKPSETELDDESIESETLVSVYQMLNHGITSVELSLEEVEQLV